MIPEVYKKNLTVLRVFMLKAFHSYQPSLARKTSFLPQLMGKWSFFHTKKSLSNQSMLGGKHHDWWFTNNVSYGQEIIRPDKTPKKTDLLEEGKHEICLHATLMDLHMSHHLDILPSTQTLHH